jgi:hypothetical protein
MTSWEMFWLLKLDVLDDVFLGLGLVFIFVPIIIIGIINGCYEGNSEKSPKAIKLWKLLFVTLPLGFLLAFSSAFIPSTKEMAAIIVVPKMITAIDKNEQLKKMPDKLINLADEWITKLTPENIQKTK